jgi:aminopeptidase N
MKFHFLYSCLILSIVLSCDSKVDVDAAKIIHTPQAIKDAHSYANINEIRTTHLHLELDVQFDRKIIYGVARHEMKNLGADTAIFDVRDLEIHKVTLGRKGEEINTSYVIGMQDSILGAPLFVKTDTNSTFINIYYQTKESSAALDWLAPELTRGKKHPYLYTQGQAILTRTWIPCQDSPSNRITYSADVKVPEELMALMSAENPTQKSTTGEYHFEMKQPIPAYLIALAVGNLEYRKLGENCGVYSEPEMIKSVAWEFQDLNNMILAAENLYGKYQWEQYDIIVLPYSFPFGGMENPRLTFANPTLIAGDRSMVSVIAHELAHSWSGNLVTNATCPPAMYRPIVFWLTPLASASCALAPCLRFTEINHAYASLHATVILEAVSSASCSTSASLALRLDSLALAVLHASTALSNRVLLIISS